MSSKKDTVFLSQSEIEKLSDDPKNRVYKYEYDDATQLYTSQEQKKFITSIRTQFQAMRDSDPTLSDREIQKQLRKNTSIDKFAENNTKIFETCCKRETTDEQLNHIRYMLYLREQQERGAISEVTAQETIQNYLINSFRTDMTVDQYKQKMAEEKKYKKKNVK